MVIRSSLAKDPLGPPQQSFSGVTSYPGFVSELPKKTTTILPFKFEARTFLQKY
jgi:hypothetical protein